MRLAGVLDDGYPVAVRELQQLPPAGARAPEEVHRNDRLNLLFLERPGPRRRRRDTGSPGSTSAKTGVAPAWRMPIAV